MTVLAALPHQNSIHANTLGVVLVPATGPVVEVGRDKDQTEEHMSKKATDPVCGMRVNPDSAAASVEHDGNTYYFCAKHCAQTFKADPATYAGAVA